LSWRKIKPGASIYYDVTYTNNGVTGFDPSLYNTVDGYSKQFGNFLYDSKSLNFVGTTNSQVACFSAGPGSGVYIGVAGQDHAQDFQIGVCAYTDNSNFIMPGETYTFRLEFTATNTINSNVDLYMFQSSTFGDPDITVLFGALSSAQEDILNSLSNDNFVRVSVAYTPQSGGTSKDTNTYGDLSSTGEDIKVALVLVTVLLTAGFGAIIARRRVKTT